MLTTTPMAASLLTLPAELRNNIYEFLVPLSDHSNGYTSFSQALQQQPALLHTCRRLRNELRPMYFSGLRLVVNVSSPEIQNFQQFVRVADERVISAFQRLSLTEPCAGYSEFNHRRWSKRTHSVLYDIELLVSGRFEKTECHGFWVGSMGRRSFGELMHRYDSLGYSTCSNWGTLPVSVEGWVGGRFRRYELLALIDGLCAHELVAPRLRGGNGGE